MAVTVNRVPRATSGRTGAKDEPSALRGVRALTEWLVLLALAVTLFRSFAVEGYMISTGSMAPSLLGYHRHILCPACGHVFAYGVSSDPAQDSGSSRVALAAATPVMVSPGPSDTATCPNCGKPGLALDGLPRTEGDQLLVHKDAFAWRELVRHQGPRRWEVAVFRNPEDATMAYVKRVAGLPGERIDLIGGEVYADGVLQRKPYEAQLGTRIPLTVQDELPRDDDPDWQPRWIPASVESNWSAADSGFAFAGAGSGGSQGAGAEPQPVQWVTYRHWIRRGGTHTTNVELEAWPPGIDLPNPLLSQLEYNAGSGRLTCYGALAWPQYERWRAVSDDPAFQQALQELYRESHVAPITDALAYNPERGAADRYPVHDLMLSLALMWQRGNGAFFVELTDGVQVLAVELDLAAGELAMRVDDETEPVRSASLASLSRGVPLNLSVSSFDRQILVAVEDVPIFAPLELEGEIEEAPLRRPVRIGARGVDVAVQHIVLYRDVYYTPVQKGEEQSYQLGRDEYFMLGDNSAVSVDSRHWDRPGVPGSMLIGKPLVVHLPSRPGTLKWGNERRQIRVPDFARIRYIR